MNSLIYKEIISHYKKQIAFVVVNQKHFFEPGQELKSEKMLYKKCYILESDKKITIEIDGFKCSFVDAIALKHDFDQLIPAKERFYYFKPEPVKKAVREIATPQKLVKKSIRRPEIKLKPLYLPKLSIFQTIKLHFKSLSHV